MRVPGQTNIPLAREKLSEIAELIRHKFPITASEMVDIIDELMTRKMPPRRGRIKCKTPTDENIKRNIVNHVLLNPHLHLDEVGRLFGVKGGRVSEIVRESKARKKSKGNE